MPQKHSLITIVLVWAAVNRWKTEHSISLVKCVNNTIYCQTARIAGFIKRFTVYTWSHNLPPLSAVIVFSSSTRCAIKNNVQTNIITRILSEPVDADIIIFRQKQNASTLIEDAKKIK